MIHYPPYTLGFPSQDSSIPCPSLSATMAGVSRPSPRSRVSRELVEMAVDSLLKRIRAKPKEKQKDTIYLILTLTKIPHRNHPKHYYLPLPHPLHHPSSAFLVADDRPDSPLTPSAARALVRSLSLPISHILSLSDLRNGDLPAGDLVFADLRIAPSLLRLLRHHSSGEKENKKNRKRSAPVLLNLSNKSWPEYLRRACFSTVLNLGSGTCCGIKVGIASHPRGEIVDNVMAAVDGAVNNVQRRWSNVAAFHLKTSESLALPIYQRNDRAKPGFSRHEDDDDVSEQEEQSAAEELEGGKPAGKVKRPEGASAGKRSRTVSDLGGGELRGIRRNILSH